jgi:hypothetical protein
MPLLSPYHNDEATGSSVTAPSLLHVRERLCSRHHDTGDASDRHFAVCCEGVSAAETATLIRLSSLAYWLSYLPLFLHPSLESNKTAQSARQP